MKAKDILVLIIGLIIITAVLTGLFILTLYAWDIKINLKILLLRLITFIMIWCLFIVCTTKIIRFAWKKGDTVGYAIRKKILDELLPDDEVLKTVLLRVLADINFKRTGQEVKSKIDELNKTLRSKSGKKGK